MKEKTVVELLQEAKLEINDSLFVCDHSKHKIGELIVHAKKNIDEAIAKLSKEPKPTEFTKECREMVKTSDDEKRLSFEFAEYVFWLKVKKYLEQACDIIEQLQVEKSICPECRFPLTKLQDKSEEEIKDIVERLEQEADDCRVYDQIVAADLMEEAAHEIEELRSLLEAVREGR